VGRTISVHSIAIMWGRRVGGGLIRAQTRPARRPDQPTLRDSMQKGGRWVGDDDMLTHAGYPPPHTHSSRHGP